MEDRQDDYLISTDETRLELHLICEYLSRSSYWAEGRPLDVVQRSIENSLCFGLYEGKQQVGFARVVTDYATFAWLCDVFVLESHRGRGLGKWLIRTVVAHPKLQNLDIFVLATRDAHELYRHYGGFQQLPVPGKWMVRRHD
jgi:GNAT superfamily N-acetyltransferase